MLLEIPEKFRGLLERINHDMVCLDVVEKEKEVTSLEHLITGDGFWEDSDNSQRVMRRLSGLKKTVDQWRGLEKRVVELAELAGLAGADSEMTEVVESETSELETELDKLEFELAYSGEYDERNAILAIHAGAGGVESQDWAEMLLNMYLKWAERRDYEAEILETSAGDEAGIKSVTVMVRGRYAYGSLRSEHGVHRLIRLSPFDSDHARHTSFALVEIMPEAEEDTDIEINPDDIKLEAFRASGAGGQNVQKVSSAVRITHVPSGLVVTAQTERSQHQNREMAMGLLKARLLKRKIAEQEAERARIKGDRISNEWGSQIRSYVLHPYKMIKDHRTGVETGNPQVVLEEGQLDMFIEAYLKGQITSE
ncbi:MAG: peptide chain release factor 2 [Dehalogenimonas sp.]|uniref:Peptide chain release factor 2 n=2 Tax=Candidatus Dehalogenimonas loeffleri TaxID=3127115 RepID=A0ABZ2J2E2_9CHLR|nr:peptide chain release factor 2 [Dehalogenimonas sp.]